MPRRAVNGVRYIEQGSPGTHEALLASGPLLTTGEGRARLAPAAGLGWRLRRPSCS